MKNKIIITLLIAIITSVSTQSLAQDWFDGLLVGIADYPGSGSNLEGPVNDINVLYTTLRTHQNWDDLGDLTKLSDSNATESAIQNAIEALRQSSEHKCLFYFSGHGDESPTAGLEPYDPDFTDRITKSELSSWFTSSKVIWIINSCYSGQFANISTGGIAITACGSTELAWEYREIDSIKHSVFTSYLIDGLVNDTADDGDDGNYVSVEELYDYVDDRTTDYVEDVMFPDEDPRINTQHPQIDDDWSGECDLEASTGNDPAAVTHFQCTNPTSWNNPPSFSWTSSIGATWYHVFRSKNGGGYTNVATLQTTTWIDYDVQLQSLGVDDFAYKIICRDGDYWSGWSDIVEISGIEFDKPSIESENHLPKKYDLSQNYPNPFNPVTEIRYQIPKASKVTITIYNSIGQQVAILVNETKSAGLYTVKWNASNVASGTYIYKIVAGEFTAVKKMVVIK
ncbi:caspase family protein [candidate division KSB1 bacterium]